MNKKEHKYYKYDEYDYYIKLEQLGLALDYARNAIDTSTDMCSDCQQMEIIDNLTDAIVKSKINLFKKGITKEQVWTVLQNELFNSKSNFGENLKTREYLHNEILNSSVVLNG